MQFALGRKRKPFADALYESRRGPAKLNVSVRLIVEAKACGPRFGPQIPMRDLGKVHPESQDLRVMPVFNVEGDRYSFYRPDIVSRLLANLNHEIEDQAFASVWEAARFDQTAVWILRASKKLGDLPGFRKSQIFQSNWVTVKCSKLICHVPLLSVPDGSR
jgi:hypothetical protein